MKIRSIIAISLLLLTATIAGAQIPAGYYNPATGLTGQQLKTALHRIIRHHSKLSYAALWTAFYTTDDKPNGTVWDMYSDIQDGSLNGNPPYVYNFGTNQCAITPGYENYCYNREHSFPNSWFGAVETDTMYTDLFHLYPTDSKVNSMRSNNPYGQVNAPTWTSLNGSKLGPCVTPGFTGTVFEPRDEFKGDLARTYFYMATRYESRIASWQPLSSADEILDGTSFPCYDSWFLNLMLAWNTADPVSQKEIDRNNTIYTSFQHNRNPFIDHPEYVNAVWGGSVLTATPVALSGFTYAVGAGPSTSLNYVLNGTLLTPAAGNITITGTTDFEVSTNNTTFSSSATVAYNASNLANTTIYVRLKSGTAAGIYSNELVTNTGGGAATVNVSCSGSVTGPTVLPEPSNYPSNFSAHNLQLQWIDATGTFAPTGYLIRMSPSGFSAIASPADGIAVPNGPNDLNVAAGIQSALFTGLSPNTTYYFKLFGYTGSGATINYKIDGDVPQTQQTTGQ